MIVEIDYKNQCDKESWKITYLDKINNWINV